MNLEDMDPKLFQEAVSAIAADAKKRFNREVDDRIAALNKGLADAAKWDLSAEMGGLFAQWFSKEAVVFTFSIPDPSPGFMRYDNEGAVVLKFNGYEFEIGRMKNLERLHNSRAIFFVVPEKKESKP